MVISSEREGVESASSALGTANRKPRTLGWYVGGDSRRLGGDRRDATGHRSLKENHKVGARLDHGDGGTSGSGSSVTTM